MFYILGLFFNSVFFVFFLVDWLGGTSGEAPLSESVKSIAAKADPPKPRLHASLSP
jgi:hypothetical protein